MGAFSLIVVINLLNRYSCIMADAWNSSLLRKNESELVKQKFSYPKLLTSKLTTNRNFSISKLKRNLDCTMNTNESDNKIEHESALVKRQKLDSFVPLMKD